MRLVRSLAVGLVVAVLATDLLVAPASAVAADAVPTPAPSAFEQAKASGQPVPLDQLTSQYVFAQANPDGTTFSADITPSPVRILVDGAWRDLDMTLQSGATAVTPIVAGNTVEFASGGAASNSLARLATPKDLLDAAAASFKDLAAESTVGRSANGQDPAVALGWPSGQVPVPQINGSSARYSQVAGGIDAEVQALPRGFELSLVANQPPAASGQAVTSAGQVVEFPLSLAGACK